MMRLVDSFVLFLLTHYLLYSLLLLLLLLRLLSQHYEKHIQEWQRGPMGLAAAQQAYIRARGQDDPAVPPLPDGWKEELDEVTGISFFIDTTTGKRTWVRPGFIPPPPGQAPPPRYASVPPPPPRMPMMPPGGPVPPPSHLPPPPQPPGYKPY